MSGQAENVWDKFAAENAEYYIITDRNDYSSDAARKSFYRTGEEFTNLTLEEVEGLIPGYDHALEIGCGIGRLTFPHAKRFRNVTAVDVSPIMLERIRENAITFGASNIHSCLPDQRWDDNRFDYIYSFLVFQHIGEMNHITNYVQRIGSCLKPGGVAQLQFDTRPANLIYTVRNRLPDLLLPKNQKKGIRRIRRDPMMLRKLFGQSNLNVIRERYRDSAEHTFILRPTE